MTDDKNNFTNIERKVQSFFQKQATSLKASKDLWPKIEARLDEKVTDAGAKSTKRGLRQWLVGPRLIVASTSISAVLILIVVGSMWLTTNHPANITPSNILVRSGIEHGAAPQPTIVATTTVAMPTSTAIVAEPVTTTPTVWGLNPSGGTVFGPINSNSTDSNSDVLDTIGKQVISQASVSLEVNTVSTALSQVETMVQNLGGSVDSMSSNGEQNQEQATVTIRVPQDQFLTALDKLQSLGTVQNQNITSQDVTQQYIDLQAQLNSAQLEEQSLQAILAKATTVSDEIAIQEQLTQVIAQAENLQGQINYIQNQVDMATITVTLNEPTQNVGQPPSASLSVAVSNVDSSLASVKQLISGVGGIIDSSSISLNNGKESAYLSLQVYRANFDQIVLAIGKEGKIQQKTVQEAVTAQNGQAQQGNSPPDASISLSLIESSGFWTTTNILVISITGGVVIIALLVFLVLVGKAGLLRRRIS